LLCFLGKTGATITGTVTGLRQYSHDVPQDGLEIPWVMKFAGSKAMVNKAKSMLLDKKRAVPVSISVPVRVCGAGTGT